jgi:hypothetical protein
MRRISAALVVLLVINAVGAALWSVLYPPVAPFLAAEASNLRVQDLGVGQRLISYHAPGAPYAWRSSVALGLERNGWSIPRWRDPAMPRQSYLRLSRRWFGTLWEQADLEGEPNSARILVRRRIEMGWHWRRLWNSILAVGVW